MFFLFFLFILYSILIFFLIIKIAHSKNYIFKIGHIIETNNKNFLVLLFYCIFFLIFIFSNSIYSNYAIPIFFITIIIPEAYIFYMRFKTQKRH